MTSKRRKVNKKGRVFLLLSLALLFFVLSLVLYKFQYLFPNISTDNPEVLRPVSMKKEHLDLTSALVKNNIDFESVKESTQSSTIIVALSNKSFVYFKLSSDVESQAKLLSSLLSRIAIENPNKKLSYIDLRFDKAVVKFR